MSTSSDVSLNDSSPETLELSRLLIKTLAVPKRRLHQTKLRYRAKRFYAACPEEAAKDAGLRYVTDKSPGISRKRNGKSFVYLDPEGKRIDNETTLKRIKALAIPPAWGFVWICASANGHLQATGRDARNRKQYRYHPKWKEVRDATKFDKMIAFGQALPLIRTRIEADLERPGLGREKVLATIIRLLEITLIRVGNEEYVKANDSYGLTTLRDKHVQIMGSKIRFRFKGKSGKQHDVGIQDRRLARILKRCQEIPGYELFQYLDENGQTVSLDSSDVNTYLREISNQDLTAKDFRTWAGTILTAMALQLIHSGNGSLPEKKNLNQAVQMVANILGNTPAVCRKCYIHPALMQGYLEGGLLDSIRLRESDRSVGVVEGLAPEEAVLLKYLQKSANGTANSVT